MTTLPKSTDRPAAPPEALGDDPPLTAVMTADVVVVDAEARVPTALHVMATTGVRHLPVVDRGRCLGVLVETDLVRCLAQGFPTAAGAVTASLRQLYRPAPELPARARVSDAARHVSADVSDAVLVADHGRLLGIVTATDLVRLLARLDAQRTPSAP
jgi:signal-transduction protein with cAMP-binding, CBS, and nucleotidyltransferase domain